MNIEMTDTKSREVLSPEGVEERIEIEETFRITLTIGGKFRVYLVHNGKADSIGVVDDLKRAKEQMGMAMLVSGGLITDPMKTIDHLLKGFDKPPKEPNHE